MEYFGLRTVLDPENIVITQSDLASFKRDRRLWFFRTYLGLQPIHQSVTSPLILGTLVHGALEFEYRGTLPIMDAYAGVVHASRAYYECVEPAFDIHGWNKQVELGRIMLEGFIEWRTAEHIDADIRTVSVEKLLQVKTEYLGSPVTLTGKADLIVQDRLTGETLIYDFKTTNNLQRTIKQAHTTEQLPFYLTLQQTIHPDEWVNGAAFYLLLKSRRTARAAPPFYHREKVSYTNKGLEMCRAGLHGAIRDYVRVLQDLHAGTDKPFLHAYPNPGVLQFDHSYDLLIDVINSGGNVPAMISANFVQTSPYARYDTSYLPDE